VWVLIFMAQNSQLACFFYISAMFTLRCQRQTDMFTATAARVLHEGRLRAALSAGVEEPNPEGEPRKAAAETLTKQLDDGEGKQGEQQPR